SYRSVRHHFVERVGARIDHVGMTGHDQHPVRVRVRKIPKRYQPLVLVSPIIIEGAYVHQGLNLVETIHSEQIAKSRITGLLWVTCHDRVKPEIRAAPKDRNPTYAHELTLFRIAHVG